MDIKAFYERQISLSEWFESLNYKSKKEFRLEDNEKRDRLAFLKKTIGLPFDQPVKFQALDLSKNSKKFEDFYKKHSEEYCALRLIPKDPELPKLRMRGLIIRKACEWFKEQEIDPSKYRADFIPHSERPLWSTIFVVNKRGIYGEIIQGMLNQLSQGIFNNNKPMLFAYDFKSLKLSRQIDGAEEEVRRVINYLHVKDKKKRTKIKKKFNVKFFHNYLEGYFETISTQDYGLWFVDFNRILGRIYKGFTIDSAMLKRTNRRTSTKIVVHGRSASSGKAKGFARIVNEKDVFKSVIEKGDILVCEMTTPDYIMHIKNAAAVVTDKGGILCHAAIVAREFGIPCIVGTGDATKKIKDGMKVEVDATKGTVRLLR